MNDRSARVSLLALAFYETEGDPKRFEERLKFFSNLTEVDIRNAIDLANWFKTEAGQESLMVMRAAQKKAAE